MGNRTLKESIRTSKSVNDLTDFQFRLWAYLITFADDFGRGSADADILKGFVFPKRKSITTQQIQRTLDDLADKDMIRLYTVDGDSFFYFPTWGKHQKIQNAKSEYPEPPSCAENNCNGKEDANNSTEAEPKGTPKKTRATNFVVPTREEVRAYAAERGSSVNPDKFYDYFDAGNWVDSEGKKVRSWRQKFITWEKFAAKRGGTNGSVSDKQNTQQSGGTKWVLPGVETFDDG